MIGGQRRRTEALEARQAVPSLAARRTTSGLWLVETRDPAGGSGYPTDWRTNVFRCAFLAREFTETVGEQTLTDDYLSDDSDATMLPAWAYVHCPWFVPLGYRFLAYQEPSTRLWHAVDPPNSLVGYCAAGISGSSGTYPAVTPAVGTIDLYDLNSTDQEEQVTYGDTPVDVTLPVLNWLSESVSAETMVHCVAVQGRLRNAGYWVPIVVPCT